MPWDEESSGLESIGLFYGSVPLCDPVGMIRITVMDGHENKLVVCKLSRFFNQVVGFSSGVGA